MASVQQMKGYRFSWMTFLVDLCWHNANSLLITTLQFSALTANVTREAYACQPVCLNWKLELPFQPGEKKPETTVAPAEAGEEKTPADWTETLSQCLNAQTANQA